jgi:hypothetical protein
MKKLFFVLLLLPVIANCQKLIGGSNILKWNIGSMALRNYHFTYERSLFKHVSLSISYRTMPTGNVPFESQLKSAINSSDINFDRFQMSNSAITPELRIYLSARKMRGFYLAPYARFANFDVTAPVRYTSTTVIGTVTKDADFGGKIKSTSGGLMIGYQFQILKKLVLDFQIIGGHYGNSTGDLNFAAPLNAQEQQSLRDNLAKVKADPFKFTYTVNSNGAIINTDGPWAGIRGLNLGIGLRF